MNDPQPEGHMARYIGRRKFLATLLGGAAAAWPLAAGAQETAMPVVAFVTPSERDSFPPRYVAAFRKGLSDTGYIEGQNVSVEYHWLEGRYDRLPALMADLVRRQVAVIATPGGSFTALAAKAATATIPIVFGVAENPVSTGLVANLARPGSNATGINFFLGEVVAKRLGLLHELVPKAVRLGVLVNPANGLTAEATLRDIPEAARTLGLQVQVLKASTGPEIDAGFSAMVRDRADALFIAPDAFFVSRRVQFATLARRRDPRGARRDRATVTHLLQDHHRLWRPSQAGHQGGARRGARPRGGRRRAPHPRLALSAVRGAGRDPRGLGPSRPGCGTRGRVARALQPLCAALSR